MQTQLDRIEEKLNILLERTEPKKHPRQTKMQDTRTLDEQVELYRGQYAPSMIEDFILYWDEQDRWKKEKTWEISKRLVRWQRQQEKWQYEREAKQQLKKVEERPVERSERMSSGFQIAGSLFDKYAP